MTPEDSVPEEGTMHLKWQPQDAPPQDTPPDEGTVRLGGRGAVPAQAPQGPDPRVQPAAEQGTVRLGGKHGVPAQPPVPTPVPLPAVEEEPDGGYIPTVMAAQAAEAVAAAEAEAQPEAAAGDPGLIRFGPGVPDPKTARTIAVWQGQALPAAEAPAEEEQKKKRSLWFWIPVLLVFLGLLAWYLLRMFGSPAIQLTGATIAVSPTAVTCDGKATVTATVSTNGEAGSFTYHWLRSDGTDSGSLTETVAAGTRQVELPLIWQLSGPGTLHATATLAITDYPAIKPSISFDYACKA